MPRGRPPRPDPPPDDEVILLSSADILASVSLTPRGPVSTRGRPSGSPVADPLIGMVLADRYRILEPIGRGGMGCVYKVQHTRIGKLLAMKLLAGEMSQRPEVVRRFKREALAVSKLGSPNTVQVFDFGVHEGLTYLVMELVNGHDLGSVLKAEGPMPLVRIGRIILQVCNALAEAHRVGIVHRDVKPENIMLVPAAGGADLVKVLDFGLAKLRGEGGPPWGQAPALDGGSRSLHGADEETCRGTIVGTPSYMAPEQILGQEVDARTDVYAVGALMYRMATGRPPFRGGSHMEVLTKHLTEAPVPPSDLVPDLGIPLALSRLTMRALRKDPADRFQRIEDLQALLAEEMRRAGSSSVESLLDPDRLRRIARAERPSDPAPDALATRHEVDAYERRLRNKRYGAAVTVVALAAISAGTALLLPRASRRPPFVEVEPNDTAAEATPMSLGQPMTGTIGRRLDATRGDRDFYAIDLPAGAPGSRSVLRLRVSALPSFATCTLLYRAGFADPVGRYCAGRPGRDLSIPALDLAPGRYLLAVLQDMDAYGGASPYVQESISDSYTITAERASAEEGAEVEPNDTRASATPVALGRPCTAAIGWARDEDVFCVPEAVGGALRWRVRAGVREGGVLEATPMRGDDAGAPVRIHLDEGGRRGEGDVQSPWRSDPVAGGPSGPRCLRVRLAGDPGGSEPYVVEAEAVP